MTMVTLVKPSSSLGRAEAVGRAGALRRLLLLCGVASTLLYVETDVIGGIVCPGYDFGSQAISELMAAGSPSERVVDPLFLSYDVLLVLFGFGVLTQGRAAGTTRTARAGRPRVGNGQRRAGRGSVAPPIHGRVAPGFEEVRDEFERNFVERGDIGAAVAAYWRGEKVVDLWGGSRTTHGDEPWERDTMVVVQSVTKGLSAMTLAVANARGWLDYDAPVARYWPEFAQNGKADITVRQLLGHEAGLVLLDERLSNEKMRDLDYVARVLARQKPAWPPGTRHGYHTVTIGLYMQELIRRTDPAHRTLGRFFHEEIAKPLGLDFYIGLPHDLPDRRLAKLRTLSRRRGLAALRYTPLATTLKMIRPGSLLRRSFVGLIADPNDREYLEIEVPAGNGVGTARAIARAYSAFAEGGAEIGITAETFAALTRPPQVDDPADAVVGTPSYFSLGFLRPGPDVGFGSSLHAFGAPGAGGSFAFADPGAHLGYAYVMNKLDFYLVDDPRETALRDAVHRAIAQAEKAETGTLPKRSFGELEKSAQAATLFDRDDAPGDAEARNHSARTIGVTP